MSRVIKNLLFAYINAKTKSQIRCAVHVTAQLIGAHVFATETSVSDPKTVFFSQRGSYPIIMISNHFKRAYQLASSVWGLESLVGLRQFIH